MNLSLQENGLMDDSNDAQLAKTGLVDKKNNPKLKNIIGNDLNISNNNSVFDMSQQIGISMPDQSNFQLPN